jgi:hypothetical protein
MNEITKQRVLLERAGMIAQEKVWIVHIDWEGNDAQISVHRTEQGAVDHAFDIAIEAWTVDLPLYRRKGPTKEQRHAKGEDRRDAIEAYFDDDHCSHVCNIFRTELEV